MVHDSVSDFIAVVNNAVKVRHAHVRVPFSKFKLAIASLMAKCGYFASVEELSVDGLRFLKIGLKYKGLVPAIDEFVRVSKPSLRRYVDAKSLVNHKNGLGIHIVSTSSGLMTDKEAQKRGIGGEVVCSVF